MALPGREPKEHRIGHSPTAEWSSVEESPYSGPRPTLPCIFGDEPLPALREWWETVSTMPHCRLWADSDWSYALDTALLKQQFYAGEATVNLVTEIRRREDQLGTTAEARRKLRIRYVEPDSAKAAPKVANLGERRRRLRNAS